MIRIMFPPVFPFLNIPSNFPKVNWPLEKSGCISISLLREKQTPGIQNITNVVREATKVPQESMGEYSGDFRLETDFLHGKQKPQRLTIKIYKFNISKKCHKDKHKNMFQKYDTMLLC